jgi:hypothetical protein
MSRQQFETLKEKPVNIYQKINAIQKAVAYVQKDATVSQGGSYKAVSHDQVTSVTRPHFVEIGVLIVPRKITSKTVEAGASKSGTVAWMNQADFEIDFVNIDDPSDKLTVSLESHAVDYSDKGPGKALSYAVKYAILKVLQLETGESDESREELRPKPLTDDQFLQLVSLVDELEFQPETLNAMALKAFDVKNPRDIPSSRFVEACDLLRSKSNKKVKA